MAEPLHVGTLSADHLYRVLVTGSRTWDDPEAVVFELAGLSLQHAPIVVIHGAARDGADRFARLAANAIGVPEEPHPADWHKYNRRAGMIRNAEMVKAGADVCLAFIMPCRLASCDRGGPHGTHGATHCADLAGKAAIEVRRFTSSSGEEM
jgi:hypothetical protein